MATPSNMGAAAAAHFSSTAPVGATPWTVLKLIGMETITIVVLTVIAGVGPSGANFALAIVAILWLLLLVTHD